MSFFLPIPYIVWLVLSALLFAGVEFFSKKFGFSHSLKDVGLLFIFDILAVLAWLPAIVQKNQLSIVGVMWALLSLAVTVIIGLLVFGEKLSIVGVIGLVLAFISIALLSVA